MSAYSSIIYIHFRSSTKTQETLHTLYLHKAVKKYYRVSGSYHYEGMMTMLLEHCGCAAETHRIGTEGTRKNEGTLGAHTRGAN